MLSAAPPVSTTACYALPGIRRSRDCLVVLICLYLPCHFDIYLPRHVITYRTCSAAWNPIATAFLYAEACTYPQLVQEVDMVTTELLASLITSGSVLTISGEVITSNGEKGMSFEALIDSTCNCCIADRKPHALYLSSVGNSVENIASSQTPHTACLLFGASSFWNKSRQNCLKPYPFSPGSSLTFAICPVP